MFGLRSASLAHVTMKGAVRRHADAAEALYRIHCRLRLLRVRGSRNLRRVKRLSTSSSAPNALGDLIVRRAVEPVDVEPVDVVGNINRRTVLVAVTSTPAFSVVIIERAGHPKTALGAL